MAVDVDDDRPTRRERVVHTIVRIPIGPASACYLLCQLLISGLIFDVSHPLGWILGVVGVQALMGSAPFDRSRLRVPFDAVWIAVAVVLGTGVGIVAGWTGGGVGGMFGWGPTS